MFSIAHIDQLQTIWAPIVDSDTVYVGSLLVVSDEGVKPLPVASGAADTTNKNVIFGICVGTNNRTPVYNTTYMAEYITDATPLASTTEFAGVEGPWNKYNHCAMACVAIVDPSTVIRGDIFDGATGTAMTVATVTIGAAAAKSCTCDGIGFPPATTKMSKGYGTVHFRSGGNKGSYRILDSNASKALTWDKALYTRCVAGDTLVAVNGLRPIGLSQMQIGTEAGYIDGGTDASTNYFSVTVHRLDLRTAGKEFCEFRFNTCHFDPKRA